MTMRAIQYAAPGDLSQLKLVEIPRPQLACSRDVMIKVAAAALNPLDSKLRQHNVKGPWRPLPKIPGVDLSGVVVEKGKSSRFLVGDRVVCCLEKLFHQRGALAEYVVVKDGLVARAPTNCSLVDAAALPLVGLTILQATRPLVTAFKKSTPENVHRRGLVHAGSGGVGSFAIQFCKKVLDIQEVWTTCRSEKSGVVMGCGADAVVDYTTVDDLKAALDQATGGAGFEAIIDPMPFYYEEISLAVLAPRGHYFHIASSKLGPQPNNPDPLRLAIPEASAGYIFRQAGKAIKRTLLFWRHRGYYHGPSYVYPSGSELEELVALVQSNDILPVVGSKYQLASAVEGFRELESGHAKGKIIIVINDHL
jgi:alcohol dehydrogenase